MPSFFFMLPHLIGFCLFIGWIFPFYGLPIYSFYQEWLGGTLLCACFFFAIWNRKSKRALVVPMVAWAVLGLFAVGVVQSLLGMHPYPPAIALYGVAGVLFWMAVILGANMKPAQRGTCTGLDQNFLVISRWILASAVLSAVITLLQVINWDIHLFPLVRSPDLTMNRPSANLSQPNLMTLQLVMGLVVLGWMYVEGKISPAVSASIVTLIAVAVFFANTRAYLLMLGGLAVFSWKIESPRANIVRWWVCVLLPIIFIVSAPFHESVMGSLGHAGRNSLNMTAQTDGRWKIWGATIQMIQAHPMLGVGLGAYSVGFYDQATSLYGTIGATGNAHNIFLQIIAECGLFAGIVILMLALLWMFKAFKSKEKANSIIFCNAAIAAILAHSLVEFPLWYIFFLIPFGFFLGITSRVKLKKACKIKIEKKYSFTGIIVAIILSSWIYIDYSKIREFFENAVTIGNTSAIEELQQYNKPSWLSWHLNYAKFLFMSEEENSLEKIWIAGRETAPRFPFSKGLMRFAYVSASTDHLGAAQKALAVMYRMRPMAYKAFKVEINEACPNESQMDTPYCKLKQISNQLSMEFDR